ncbi:WbqC family protein [bacterium]|nr:WbqC family protein [bacterium]
MRLGAHQPGYLPAIQFFQKMARADVFLLADDLQYSTRDQVNRTQIKTINGSDWLSVPVLSKSRLRQCISEVEIDNHSDWFQKHLRTLEVNYQNAAYFGLYFDWLTDLLKQPRKLLLDLNLDLIHFAKKHLFLKTTTLHRFSELALQGNTNQRLIQAMQQFECDTYLVEAAFQPYVDVAAFEAAGFQVEFMNPEQPQYWQQFGRFEPNLSIVDLLLNEGEMSYRLVKP